jgi:tetratricopeptide (TPR) repeat protein
MANSVSTLRKSLALFVLSVALMGSVGAETLPASALTDELLEKAEEPFFEGVSAYGKREYAKAAAKFKAAFDVIPHPDLLFNIARCHERLKNFTLAVRMYRKYLATQPVDETAVIHRVRGLEKRIGPLGDEPPVDPVKGPEAPPVAVDVRAGGDVPWEYVAVGVGIIGAALGAAFGLQALTHAEEAQEASDDDDRDAFDNSKALAESSATFADISYLVGAASAGVAVWLFTSKSADSEMEGFSIGIDPRGLRVRLGF